MAPYSVYECYFTMGVIFVLDFGRKEQHFFEICFPIFVLPSFCSIKAAFSSFI